MTTPAGQPPGGPPSGPPGGGAYQQPPQWQPPPRPPPPPKNRRGWLRGSGALVVAAVTLGVTLVVVLRAGGSKDDTSSAKATMQSFLNAAVDYEVDPATVTGDTARTKGRVIADNGGDNEIVVELTDDGGTWKISELLIRAGSEGPGGIRS